MSESLPCQASKFMDKALCSVSKPFQTATVPFAGTPCALSNMNTFVLCNLFKILEPEKSLFCVMLRFLNSSFL